MSQTSIAEEFTLKIREYGGLMFYGVPAFDSSNWAKFPLLLVETFSFRKSLPPLSLYKPKNKENWADILLAHLAAVACG